MPPELLSGPQRRLDVHGVVASEVSECRPRDGLGHGMEGDRVPSDRGRGEAAAVDRDRVADIRARGGLGCAHDERPAAAGLLRLDHAAELADDPREHGKRVTSYGSWT